MNVITERKSPVRFQTLDLFSEFIPQDEIKNAMNKNHFRKIEPTLKDEHTVNAINLQTKELVYFAPWEWVDVIW